MLQITPLQPEGRGVDLVYPSPTGGDLMPTPTPKVTSTLVPAVSTTPTPTAVATHVATSSATVSPTPTPTPAPDSKVLDLNTAGIAAGAAIATVVVITAARSALPKITSKFSKNK